jgi:tRNA pseudouridine38-40 synthase
MKRNIVLKITFDGTRYHGWQRQTEGISTVQQVLEDGLGEILKHRVTLTGCSRTDAGVHANEYCCNFKTDSRIPCDKLPFALNTKTPATISVLAAYEAPLEFSTRFSCKGKEYLYQIWTHAHKNPFYANRAWHYHSHLDMEKMQKAAEYMIGKQDFSSFMAAGSSIKSPVRNLMSVFIEQEKELISIRTYADGYLYNMVRIICGTLVYVGNGKLSPEQVPQILAGRQRALAGPTAPPQGLYLNRVDY